MSQTYRVGIIGCGGMGKSSRQRLYTKTSHQAGGGNGYQAGIG